MKTEDNGEDALLYHAERYVKLEKRYGQGARAVESEYEKLRELLIAEIYFMPGIKHITGSEEVADFIVEVEPEFRALVRKYDKERSSFRSYIKTSLEFKAMAFRRKQNRKESINLSYCMHFYPYAPDNHLVDEINTDPVIRAIMEMDKGNDPEYEVLEQISSICLKKPNQQRRLFIYLCTILPFLSIDMIEKICSTINCNLPQTVAIADYLYVAGIEGRKTKRSNLIYLGERLDYVFMRTVEIETRIYRSTQSYMQSEGGQRLKARLEHNRRIFRNLENFRKNAKKHVDYSIIAEVLNISVSDVSNSVYYAHLLLGGLLDGNGNPEEKEGPESSRQPRFVLTESRKTIMEKCLDPFRTFGISLIENPVKEPAPKPPRRRPRPRAEQLMLDPNLDPEAMRALQQFIVTQNTRQAVRELSEC